MEKYKYQGNQPRHNNIESPITQLDNVYVWYPS